MLLAPPKDGENLSIFSMFLGQNINLTPLGSAFNAWFPLFILIPVIFTLFNLYEMIRGILGLGDLGGWIIDDEEDEDRGEIASVVEGRSILKRELGLTSGDGPGPSIARRGPREGRSLAGERSTRPTYSDPIDDDEDEDENFLISTGHRLWNTITNKVDDLRSSRTSGDRPIDDEEGGLLARIPRPKWLKRGDSGVGVWRLPRWGRGEEQGRVLL
jgi:hypothetical protein